MSSGEDLSIWFTESVGGGADYSTRLPRPFTMISERKKLFLDDGILSRFSPNGVYASLERYEADSSNNQGAKYEHAKN